MSTQVLKYTIMVTGPAYGTQAAFCAYQFCQSLVNTHHKIESIFFYQDGIYNANSFTNPANDEFDLVLAWQNLSQKHNIPLAVCISAAQRRGVVNETKSNLASGFELAGLSEFSDKVAISGRVIQF